MPGPTTKSNPWAEELKKSRRKSSKGLSGKESVDIDKKLVKSSGDDKIDPVSGGGGGGGGGGGDGICDADGGKATPALNLDVTKEMTSKPLLPALPLKQNDPKKVNLAHTAPHEVAKTVTTTTPTADKKCVNDKVRPATPKAKPPSLPDNDNAGDSSRSLYQDARSHLRPVARMLSRQMSKDTKEEATTAAHDDHDETPVDMLIRQGSLEMQLPVKFMSKNSDEKGTVDLGPLFFLF